MADRRGDRQAAYYTGPGVGGFLNATFGNAPELIIALVAVSDGLTDVVRASLVGSIVGNLLLVLGFTLLFGQPARSTGGRPRSRSASCRSRRCSCSSLPFRAFTAIPIAARSPMLALPFAAVLLIVRVPVTRYALRRQRAL